MFKVSRSVARPIAMFVDQSDAAMIDAAIDAGVSAYIVDGLRTDRVKPILDTTISRFNAFAKLKKELETVKSQLEDRKAIDRAKALVMLCPCHWGGLTGTRPNRPCRRRTAAAPYPIPGTKMAASLLVGYQFAVTPHPVILTPLTPLYNHSWQITARVFF